MTGKKMECDIITIGDEILIGQIVDTNSAWLGVELNHMGIGIRKIISIGDDKNIIIKTIKESISEVSLTIITGGLGPTRDDITKKSLCELFGVDLIHSNVAEKRLEIIIKDKNIRDNPLNRSQVLVPENCTVLDNKMGTAPGMWFEEDKRVIISLPGVPQEMKWLMVNEVFPRLKKAFNRDTVLHKTLLVQGIGEAVLAYKLADFEDKLPKEISLAYLPSAGQLRLRLTLKKRGKNKGAKEEHNQEENLLLEKISRELSELVADNFIGFDMQSLEEGVAELLKKQKMTLSIAESCTGGNISSLITSRPGASQYFLGSIVAYNSDLKVNILGIEEEAIKKYGVVSEEIALSMAKGIAEKTGSDWGLSITGYAGPDGGDDKVPVGTVCIGIKGPNTSKSKSFNYNFSSRERVIARGTTEALALLYSSILSDIRQN